MNSGNGNNDLAINIYVLENTWNTKRQFEIFLVLL